ncbi:hypothetical protein ACFW1A_19020 [Kitasatospora sp. NPDC058965]|uniref:hypothetical protein n=1 Tax=Kitasatospora sp. NPDC058965 TaxID=3346682 RepID=UPI0036783530
MNDAAAALLGAWTGLAPTQPPQGLTAGLRHLTANGIAIHGDAVVLTDTVPHLHDTGPGGFIDLTAWECSFNSFHLEDFVPVTVEVLDGGEPVIAEADQRLLLTHGLTLALHICNLGCALEPPLPIRCIVSAGTTNGTFRFHRIRAGQHWHHPDLDAYTLEKMIVIDTSLPSS